MLADYKLVRKLGGGTYGCVYHAVRLSGGCNVAIKQIHLRGLSSKEQRETLNECQLMSSLEHERIIRYHDSFIEQGHLYIVMDYAPGGDLNQLIEKHKETDRCFGEATIWKYLIQLCEGLDYLHARRILHRDIKAHNVFIDEEDNLKIGDFGLGRRLGPQSDFAYTTVGTPLFFSPELCQENRYNDKSDIWALGCLLYQLATLSPPFSAPNHLALARKIVSESPPPLGAGFSIELNFLVKKMLEKDMARRPSVKEILLYSPVKHRVEERRLNAKAQQIEGHLISLQEDMQRELDRRRKELEDEFCQRKKQERDISASLIHQLQKEIEELRRQIRILEGKLNTEKEYHGEATQKHRMALEISKMNTEDREGHHRRENQKIREKLKHLESTLGATYCSCAPVDVKSADVPLSTDQVNIEKGDSYYPSSGSWGRTKRMSAPSFRRRDGGLKLLQLSPGISDSPRSVSSYNVNQSHPAPQNVARRIAPAGHVAMSSTYSADSSELQRPCVVAATGGSVDEQSTHLLSTLYQSRYNNAHEKRCLIDAQRSASAPISCFSFPPSVARSKSEGESLSERTQGARPEVVDSPLPCDHSEAVSAESASILLSSSARNSSLDAECRQMQEDNHERDHHAKALSTPLLVFRGPYSDESDREEPSSLGNSSFLRQRIQNRFVGTKKSGPSYRGPRRRDSGDEGKDALGEGAWSSPIPGLVGPPPIRRVPFAVDTPTLDALPAAVGGKIGKGRRNAQKNERTGSHLRPGCLIFEAKDAQAKGSRSASKRSKKPEAFPGASLISQAHAASHLVGPDSHEIHSRVGLEERETERTLLGHSSGVVTKSSSSPLHSDRASFAAMRHLHTACKAPTGKLGHKNEGKAPLVGLERREPTTIVGESPAPAQGRVCSSDHADDRELNLPLAGCSEGHIAVKLFHKADGMIEQRFSESTRNGPANASHPPDGGKREPSALDEAQSLLSAPESTGSSFYLSRSLGSLTGASVPSVSLRTPNPADTEKTRGSSTNLGTQDTVAVVSGGVQGEVKSSSISTFQLSGAHSTTMRVSRNQERLEFRQESASLKAVAALSHKSRIDSLSPGEVHHVLAREGKVISTNPPRSVGPLVPDVSDLDYATELSKSVESDVEKENIPAWSGEFISLCDRSSFDDKSCGTREMEFHSYKNFGDTYDNLKTPLTEKWRSSNPQSTSLNATPTLKAPGIVARRSAEGSPGDLLPLKEPVRRPLRSMTILQQNVSSPTPH